MTEEGSAWGERGERWGSGVKRRRQRIRERGGKRGREE
jgi:hypothetical protein